MYEFFIILLNRRMYSSRPTDQVYKCTSDIYSKIKNHRGQLVNDNTMLPSLISESCPSFTTYSNATSGILPQVIIYPSSTNDMGARRSG